MGIFDGIENKTKHYTSGGHSHNNTLISRLGFQDPDKRMPRHDLACQYLTDSRAPWWKEPFQFVARALEVPINKGRGQYSTTIGYMDARLVLRDPSIEGGRYGRLSTIGIEVKITPCSAAEVLRQIQLYNQYLTDGDYGMEDNTVMKWMLVVDFPMSEQERMALGNIGVYRLGQSFNDWCEGNRATADLPCI